MFINLFKVNEPVHEYYLYQFICEIVGLVVVSSNRKAIVVIISSAYQLIKSALIYRSVLSVRLHDLCVHFRPL